VYVINGSYGIIIQNKEKQMFTKKTKKFRTNVKYEDETISLEVSNVIHIDTDNDNGVNLLRIVFENLNMDGAEEIYLSFSDSKWTLETRTEEKEYFISDGLLKNIVVNTSELLSNRNKSKTTTLLF